MKKRTKWILGVIGTLLAGGIVLAATQGGTPVTVVAETVKRGDLSQTVEVTGDTQAVVDVDLAFQTSGAIAGLNVEVGDKVRAGDVLAVLSNGRLSAAANQAAEAVKQAQAQLDVKLAGSTDEEIAVYEAGVAAAEASLASAKAEQEQTQETGDVNVAAAEDDLTHIGTSTAEALEHAQENELEALRSLVASVRSGLASADEILGVENTLANEEFDQDLAIGDTQSFIDATNAFKEAADARDDAENALLSIDVADIDSIESAADVVYDAYEKTYTTLLEASHVLDATAADSATLSLDDLSAMKTSIASAIASLTADGSALVSARQALESAERAVTEDVTDVENALAKAKAARDQNNASAAASVASATSGLVSRQAELAQIKADPRSVDLAGLEASVAIARAQYAAALADIADAQIVSPVDGIVTEVALDRGELATAGTTIITVLGTSDQYEIVMDIPEADIAKIEVGQKSNIIFDAFGDDRIFSGSVLSINPAEKLIEGVVFYEAKVILNSEEDTMGVKPGMSASVTIHTGDRTAALFIPKRAILEDAEGKFVRIPKDTEGNFDRRSVTVGLYADDGSAEILSGLNEGETVIVTIR